MIKKPILKFTYSFYFILLFVLITFTIFCYFMTLVFKVTINK